MKLFAATLGCCLLILPSLRAEEAPDNSTQEPTTLPAIVVTGYNLEPTMPKVPLEAIGTRDVFGPAQVRETGAREINDLVQYIPAISTRPYNGGEASEMALTPPATTQAALESFDSCTPPSLPAGWKPTITGKGNPIWAVVASDDASSAPHVLRQSGSVPKPSFPVCLLESALIQNGFVETKFRTISGEIDQAAGVVWRARDATNYYVCRANALENNVVLYRVKDGQRTALNILGRQGGYGVETKVTPAQWHSLRVAFAGNRFQVSFNGHGLFIVEDDTFQLPGHVGVWTKADSVTLFDDFRFGP